MRQEGQGLCPWTRFHRTDEQVKNRVGWTVGGRIRGAGQASRLDKRHEVAYELNAHRIAIDFGWINNHLVDERPRGLQRLRIITTK